MMMEGPSKGVTDTSFKPLCGAVVRKVIVLSDKEKAMPRAGQVRPRELNESEPPY